MNNYIKQNLGKNEKVVIEAKISWFCIIPKIIGIVCAVACYFAVACGWDSINKMAEEEFNEPAPDEITLVIKVVAAIFALIPIIVNVISIIALKNVAIAVTDKRVLGKSGIISLRAIDYPINKIDNVTISAGIFGRIFKYYTLSVKTAGVAVDPRTGASMGIRFIGITNAVEFKNCVNNAIELYADEARKLQAEEIAKAMSKSK